MTEIALTDADQSLTSEDFDFLDELFEQLEENPLIIGDFLGRKNPGTAELQKLSSRYDVSISTIQKWMRVAREVPQSRRFKGVAFGVYEHLVKIPNIQQRWELFAERPNPRDWDIRSMKARVQDILMSGRGPRKLDKGGLRSGGYKVDSEFRHGTEGISNDRIRLIIHGQGTITILQLGQDMVGIEVELNRNTDPK